MSVSNLSVSAVRKDPWRGGVLAMRAIRRLMTCRGGGGGGGWGVGRKGQPYDAATIFAFVHGGQVVTGYARARFALAIRVALGVALALLLVTASRAAALEQKLTAADGAASDALGTSVSIDRDTVVLGAPGDDGRRGSVYVFQRWGDVWTNTAKLTASDGAPGDGLGSSVAISGDTIIAGAPGDALGANRGQGSIYTFARTGAAARAARRPS